MASKPTATHHNKSHSTHLRAFFPCVIFLPPECCGLFERVFFSCRLRRREFALGGLSDYGQSDLRSDQAWTAGSSSQDVKQASLHAVVTCFLAFITVTCKSPFALAYRFSVICRTWCSWDIMQQHCLGCWQRGHWAWCSCLTMGMATHRFDGKACISLDNLQLA